MWASKKDISVASRAVFALFVIFLIISPAYAGNLSPGVSDTTSLEKAGNISPGKSDTATTLSATVPTPRQEGGGSSGGSSGGGGVVTSEPLSNVVRADRQEKDVRADRATAYSFNADVYEIGLVGMENEYGITVKVEELKGRSVNVPVAPQGEVYKNLNIYAGTKRFKEVVIKFKVPASWAQDKDVRLERWSGSEWERLDTTKTSEDNSYTYYQAVSTHLSSFAIVGSAAVVNVPDEAVTAAATPGAVVTTSITETSAAPSETASNTLWYVILLVFFVIAAAVMYIYMKSR